MSYKQNTQGGGTWGDLVKMWIIRGMEGESRIEERWSDIVASRSTVRIRQWVATMIALGVVFLGLAGVGVPLALAGGVTSFLDILFVGSLVGCVLTIVVSGTVWVTRNLSPRRQVVISLLGVVLALAPVVFGCLLLGDTGWWSGPVALLGLCLFVPSLLFVYNQGVDLVDPMGWSSFFERRMLPYMTRAMEAEIQQTRIVERPLFDWRHQNRTKTIAGREKPIPIPEPTEIPTPGEDGILVIETPARDDLNLADWLAEAHNRGISRRAWLKKGEVRYILPATKTRVTRPVYDRMVELAEARGYIERGSDGSASGWLVDPVEALDDWATKLEEEWPELLQEAA